MSAELAYNRALVSCLEPVLGIGVNGVLFSGEEVYFMKYRVFSLRRINRSVFRFLAAYIQKNLTAAAAECLLLAGNTID